MYVTTIKEKTWILNHANWCFMERFGGRKGKGKLCNYVIISKQKIMKKQKPEEWHTL